MRKVITMMALAMLFCLAGIEKADAARIRIPVGSYEKMSKVMDLPQDEIYLTTDNDHFDLGVKYTVYQICWIPVWTEKSAELIGYINDEVFVPFDEDDIKVVEELNEIDDIYSYAKMPFWDAWGGKLLIIVIIGGIIALNFIKTDDEEEEAAEEEAA